LYNYGGSVEAGYLISKACKKKSLNFIVAIPRFAKSAATLIALGADEIHMGIISEMGPIDPQVGDYPALGLGAALEHIAGLCKKYPETSNMLAKYLASKLDLRDLGYLERVSDRQRSMPSASWPTSTFRPNKPLRR
jgi:membrane-bound ClpP family serine protease